MQFSPRQVARSLHRRRRHKPCLHLDSFREATPGDVSRIGIVATAGFRHSPVFEYERPYHEEYPHDTLSSYRTQFEDAIDSDEYAVYVREDEYEPNENEKTKAIIPSDNGWAPPPAGTRVIVGIVSIHRAPESQRGIKFLRDDDDCAYVCENPGRDLDREHCDALGHLTDSVLKRHCHGDSEVTMVVVHPAYWRRGHGTALLRECRHFAKTEKIPQCVCATPMSQGIFAGLGYKKVCVVEDENDDKIVGDLGLALFEFSPTAGKQILTKSLHRASLLSRTFCCFSVSKESLPEMSEVPKAWN